MLTSLFGDLGSVLDPFGRKSRAAEAAARPFEATAIMETTATEVNDQGQMIDRHQRDLVVTGSAAHAIREHFAATRTDLRAASSVITLLDPSGIWAPSVIKALSDAGGRPIERLHLREQTTLRTLAVIERTSLVRRNEDTLKVYHADVRLTGRDTADIPIALMERSHLTTVVVGPMEPSAIDELLLSLQQATSLPTWRCPNLLFMLPPSAVWIANKVKAMSWPEQMKVEAINESLTSASAVWNALLAYWNQIKDQPEWVSPAAPAMLGMRDFPIKVADLELPPSSPAGAAPAASSAGGAAVSPVFVQPTRSHLDVEHAKNSLAELLTIDGLLCCAVVDSTNGSVVAREQRDDGGDVDIDRAAAACAQVLRAHRLAARNMGLPDHIEEVNVGTGTRHHLMRMVSRHPDRFLFVLLNKQRANLSLARFKLAEVEKALV